MNTLHIASILKAELSSSNIFKGVLPRDRFIRQDMTFPSLFVCNTDNSNQPGAHWIAIHFSADKRCEYFDSYGLPPLFSDLEQKLQSIDSCFIYNTCSLQSLSTNVCGIYTIIFDVMKSKGYSLKAITDLLLSTEDKKERDHVIKHFIETKYAKTLSQLPSLPPIHCVDKVLCQASQHRCTNADVCEFLRT